MNKVRLLDDIQMQVNKLKTKLVKCSKSERLIINDELLFLLRMVHAIDSENSERIIGDIRKILE